jgi:hypothetical protein
MLIRIDQRGEILALRGFGLSLQITFKIIFIFNNIPMSLENQREWRAKNRDKVREHQRKWAQSAKGRQVLREREKRLVGTIESKARNMIKNRINRKKIPHPSFFLCTDCNKHAKHYHHEDYSLWWSVEPLCHSCHGKRHRKT